MVATMSEGVEMDGGDEGRKERRKSESGQKEREETHREKKKGGWRGKKTRKRRPYMCFFVRVWQSLVCGEGEQSHPGVPINLDMELP